LIERTHPTHSQTMYKTDFVCTYREFEEIEDDEVNADMMYRAQFLQVFGLIAYDQDAINASIELIKSKVAELPELKALVLQHPYHATLGTNANESNHEMNEDAAMDMLLVYLFAYTTMDAFHACLIDAFKTGTIRELNREKLLSAYSTMSSTSTQ